MKSTFSEGDLLSIEPRDLKKIRIGEIVAYRNNRKDESDNLIVHRIIKISSNILFTKGDNNRNIDTFPVSKENLVGKVILYERKGKLHRVIGGIVGLIIARIRYFFRRSAYLFFTKVKWILSIKIINNSINRFWKHRIQKIKINTKDGPVIKCIYRNHTIAQMLPNNTLQKSSILSYFLTETKDPSIPPSSPG